jgi:C4-dicarboxylate-specific signal transduction histidine kinase
MNQTNIDKIEIDKVIFFERILIVIGLYETTFALLGIYQVLPPNPTLNYTMLISGIAMFILFYQTRKNQSNYLLYFKIGTFFMLFHFSVALIFSVHDSFKAVWFLFMIIAAYYIANHKIGHTVTLLSLLIFIVSYLLFDINLNKVTAVMVVAAMIFASFLGIVLRSTLNKYKGYIINQNELLIAYNQELEQKVASKVQELRTKDIQLIKQEKLSIMGEMLDMIIHQWKQPLQKLYLNVTVLKEELNNNSFHNELIANKLTSIFKNIDFISQTIDDFSKFFESDKKLVSIKVEDVIDSSLNLLSHRINNSVKVTTDIRYQSHLHIYANELQQVIINLLNNAIDEFEHKKIEGVIDILVVFNQEEQCVEISVRDNAGGIDEMVVETIFNKYFTTKEDGVGLGLYICKMLVETSLNGKLEALSVESGTEFMIKLPIE